MRLKAPPLPELVAIVAVNKGIALETTDIKWNAWNESRRDGERKGGWRMIDDR
jgi:hypothetical protein